MNRSQKTICSLSVVGLLVAMFALTATKPLEAYDVAGLLAQESSDIIDEERRIDLSDIPLKTALTVIVFFGSGAFFLHVWFRWMITKEEPTWPLVAFGWYAGLVMLVTCLLSIPIWKEKLILGTSAAEKYGLRAGLGAVGVFLCFMLVIIFRNRSRSGKY
jgi:hypothetical protein